jgi:PPK2 family polyphosphate:nucleotide phosphotransferase
MAKKQPTKAKKAKGKPKAAGEQPTLTQLLRLPTGPVDLSSLDTKSTPGFPGTDKNDAPAITDALAPELGDLQERLYAQGRVGSHGPNVLIILQGMDTSGKGGVIRHAIGMVDPQGVKIKAFRAPTAEERSHQFLWRIARELPPPGIIGIFDRSQYEDVLVVRVNSLATKAVWSRRYNAINNWEAKLAAAGTVIIKCFLHISPEEQTARLRARLEDPSKHWKYNPNDVDERAKWPAYADAYADALELCNSDVAPWFVIPSDRKWYRNWAVAQLLAEHLRAMALDWPVADFDVEAELARI